MIHLNEHIVILILLLQVILDAVGDGFRVRGWQKLHHSAEAIQIGIWLALLVSTGIQVIDFQWYLVIMYILGRIWLFDPVNNLVSSRKIGYVGKSSIDGVIYHFISDKIFHNGVEHTSFIIKFMALVAWIAGLLGMFN